MILFLLSPPIILWFWIKIQLRALNKLVFKVEWGKIQGKRQATIFSEFKKFGLGLCYETALIMKASLRTILIICGVLILLGCAWFFLSIVVYILVSGVFSIMGRPLVDLFCRIRIK